tara:strand:+ start:350 stop:817 length:468 start_codon:yes stop_codon:yes gene_type:complete
MMGSQNGPDRPEFCDASTQFLERGVTKSRTHIHLAIGSRFIEAMERQEQNTQNNEIWTGSPLMRLLRLADHLPAELRSAGRLPWGHLISAVISEIRWVKLVSIIDRSWYTGSAVSLGLVQLRKLNANIGISSLASGKKLLSDWIGLDDARPGAGG